MGVIFIRDLWLRFDHRSVCVFGLLVTRTGNSSEGVCRCASDIRCDARTFHCTNSMVYSSWERVVWHGATCMVPEVDMDTPIYQHEGF
jgi:hypothetical protein